MQHRILEEYDGHYLFTTHPKVLYDELSEIFLIELTDKCWVEVMVDIV